MSERLKVDEMLKSLFTHNFKLIIVLKLARGSKERENFLIGHPNKKVLFPIALHSKGWFGRLGKKK